MTRTRLVLLAALLAACGCGGAPSPTKSEGYGAPRRDTRAEVERRMEEAIEDLRSPDASVRREAALTLGRLERTDAVPALIEALRDPEEPVRQAALAALQRLTGEDFGDDPERWTEWQEGRG